MDPTKAELTSAAYMRAKEAPRSAAPATASRERMATQMVTALNERGFRASLEVSREPKVEGRKIGEKINQIGVERGVDGAKNRTPEEQRRFDDASRLSETASKFLEKGWETPPNRGGLTLRERAAVRSFVLNEVMRRPDLAREYRALTAPADQEAFIERHIKDPRFAEKLRANLAEISQSPDLPDTVSDKLDLVSEKELEETDKNAEITDVDRRITSVQTRLDAFARPGGAAAMGPKAQELETLRTDLTTMQTDLKTHTKSYNDATHRLQMLDQEREATLISPGVPGRRPITEIDTDIGNVRTNQTDARSEVDRLTSSMGRIPQLEQEEQQLEEQNRGLVKERSDRQAELNKITLELSKRKREYQDAHSVRESAEQDIVDGLKSVWGDAANEMINEDIAILIQQADAQIEQAKTDSKNNASKAILDTITRRLTRVEVRNRWGRRRERNVIDKAETQRQFDSLMQMGPEHVMRDLLSHTRNPATNALYTTNEISALLKNSEFISESQSGVVTQILTRKLLTGGIADQDIFTLTNSDWGNGLIETAIAKNDVFRKAVEDAMGKDALNKPGFAKRLAYEMGNKRNLLMLLLLGAGLVVGGYGAIKAGRVYE